MRHGKVAQAQQQEGNPSHILEGAQGATHLFISRVCVIVMFSQRRVAFPSQQSHCPNANYSPACIVLAQEIPSGCEGHSSPKFPTLPRFTQLQIVLPNPIGTNTQHCLLKLPIGLCLVSHPLYSKLANAFEHPSQKAVYVILEGHQDSMSHGKL